MTPNWRFKLPGAEYAGPDPHGYMARDEIVERFEGMVARNHLPVQCSTAVTSVAPDEEGKGGYTVRTQGTTYQAKNVVIATGVYQQPNIPPFAASIPGHIRQMASIQYKNPGMLADGARVITALDLQQAGIQTIIWASGYRADYRMVKVPGIFSPNGLPISRGGATQAPGLYFIGLPLAGPIKTALVLGVSEFTAQVAARL